MAKLINPIPFVKEGELLFDSHTPIAITTSEYNAIVPYINGEIMTYWSGGSNASASSKVRLTPPKISNGIEAKTNLSSISIFQASSNSFMSKNEALDPAANAVADAEGPQAPTSTANDPAEA